MQRRKWQWAASPGLCACALTNKATTRIDLGGKDQPSPTGLPGNFETKEEGPSFESFVTPAVFVLSTYRVVVSLQHEDAIFLVPRSSFPSVALILEQYAVFGIVTSS
jgi:hypothetical protein